MFILKVLWGFSISVFPEHKVFFTELLALCEQDDANLQKLPCYKNVTNLVPLRQSALRAIAACHYMPECRDKIFTVLYKSLQSTITEIAETSFECMRSFIAGFQMDMEMVHQVGSGEHWAINMMRNVKGLTPESPADFTDIN